MVISHTTPYKDPCPSVGFTIGLISTVENVAIYFNVVLYVVFPR